MPRPSLLLLLLLAPTHAWGGKKATTAVEPSEDVRAHVRTLSETVSSQANRIASLEQQVKRLKAQGGTCAERTASAGDGSSPAAGGGDGEAELRGFREAERKRERKRRLEQLQAVFNVTVGSPLTALAVSSNLVLKGVPQLIAAADEAANLHVYGPEGELLASQPTEHTAAISAIGLGSRDDPILVTAGRDGRVLVHNLTLPRAAAKPHAAKANKAALAPAPPAKPAVPFSVALENEIALAPAEGAGGAAAVTALELYMRGRKFLLIVGDEAGDVRVLLRNGTERST